MQLDQIHRVYFLGIGGIGMSGLAQYFHFIGKEVAGYDKTKTELTDRLESQGIAVLDAAAVEVIPDAFMDKTNCLIVYTPAIPDAHSQLQYFKKNNYLFMKRAAVLGLLSNPTKTLAVAGTHGKTTTTVLLAHILKQANYSFTAFMGGVSEDLQTNCYIGGTEYTVVEADEFDRSFLHLQPHIASITSMDADHLDIYGTAENLHQAFKDFIKNIVDGGQLYVCEDLPLDGMPYGFGKDATVGVENLRMESGYYHFDLRWKMLKIKDMVFSKPGRHNLSNAIAASAMALEIGVAESDLRIALKSFRGVQRRFSVVLETEDMVYIDDYAHHPSELEAMYQAVRERYPNRRVLAVFQPHLYSRTKDFANEFAKVLSKFDQLALLEIYPAREHPIAGVDSSWLLEKITNANKQLVRMEALPSFVAKSDAEVVLTLGAGDIGTMVKPIKNAIVER